MRTRGYNALVDTPSTEQPGANMAGRAASHGLMASIAAQASDSPPDQLAAESPAGVRAPGWVVRAMQEEGPGLLRMLWRMLGREADVMDAYQDCFCRLAACEGRQSPRRARAYVYRTAANIAVDLLRTRTRQDAHRPAAAAAIASRRESAVPEATDDHNTVLRDRLRACLGALPPHLRSVVVLRDLGQLPYERVARILNIDATTARVYRRHAVVRLAQMMEGEAP